MNNIYAHTHTYKHENTIQANTCDAKNKYNHRKYADGQNTHRIHTIAETKTDEITQKQTYSYRYALRLGQKYGTNVQCTMSLMNLSDNLYLLIQRISN